MTEEGIHDETPGETHDPTHDDAPAGAGDSVDLSGSVLRIASVGLAFGIWFSDRMWTCTLRSFPAAAIVSCPLSPWIDRMLTVLVLLGCCSIVFNRFRLVGTITLYAGVIALILLDLNRFQPWLYEYLIIIFLCSVRENKSDLSSSESGNQKLRIVSILLIAIYFFAGLEKLNWRFFTVMGPWMLGMSTGLPPSDIRNLPIIWASATLPVAEIALALLLLFRRTRNIGIIFGTLMHAAILYLLGPLRLNTNAAVWPWNLTQIVLLVFCFLNIPKNESVFRFNPKERPLSTLVMIIVALVIPILGLLQLADAYPAFSIYSGDVPAGKIMFEKLTFRQLPRWVQNACGFYDERTGLWYVDLNDWFCLETGSSAYPSFYCFRLEARRFAQDRPGQLVVLKLYKSPKLTKDSRDHFETIGEAAKPNRSP